MSSYFTVESFFLLVLVDSDSGYPSVTSVYLILCRHSDISLSLSIVLSPYIDLRRLSVNNHVSPKVRCLESLPADSFLCILPQTPEANADNVLNLDYCCSFI